MTYGSFPELLTFRLAISPSIPSLKTLNPNPCTHLMGVLSRLGSKNSTFIGASAPSLVHHNGEFSTTARMFALKAEAVVSRKWTS